MAILGYKTRGNSSPRGKARVWFCAHPKDYVKYLEPISKEILWNENCAIWYDQQPEEEMDLESLYEDLSQMQMFVMPVTSLLLTTENRALDIEFAYAKEHHIPVLPLMQEGGLEGIFNRKCGELQFLDKYNQDASAIGYEEKLKKYLESMLIGDGLAEKIRAAFDAYIFLSYRKRDRRHAQELMKLIHSNEFCRDIAIWYDEYLTPGENFNDLIHQALEDSELFAMVVTPNLVNEQNYVMTEEYPKAHSLHKQILPLESVTTDKEELSRYYEDIPKCVDAYDQEALANALKNALERVVLRDNDKSPMHSFFMGLAYLEGIDVEVDTNRGVKLIQKAADEELPEAMRKLVQMYTYGKSVPMDYEKAIFWQKQLAEQSGRAFEGDPTVELCQEAYHELMSLGDLYNQVRDMSEAKRCFEALLPLAKFLPAKYKSIAYSRLGDWYQYNKEFEFAIEKYKQALGITEAEVRETGRRIDWMDLALDYGKIGVVYERDGLFDQAKEYYMKAEEILSRLLDEMPEGDTEVAIRYIDNKINLGDICRELDSREEAEIYYHKAYEICVQLREESRSLQANQRILTLYERLGDLCRDTENYQEALSYYENQTKIANRLVEVTQTIDANMALSNAYSRLGLTYQSCGRLSEAKDFLEKSVQIEEMLADRIQSKDALTRLAVVLTRFGDACTAKQEYTDARNCYARAIQITQDIPERMNDYEICKISYNAIQQYGGVYYKQEQYDQALPYLLKALELYRGLDKKIQTTASKHDVVAVLAMLGDVALMQKDLEQAQVYYQEQLKLTKQLQEQTPSLQRQRAVAIAISKLGNLSNVKKEYEIAEKYYLEAINIYIQAAAKQPSRNTVRDIAALYCNLGDMYCEQGTHEKAMLCYHKAQELFEKNHQAAETPDSLNELIIVYDKMTSCEEKHGDALLESDDHEEALKCYDVVLGMSHEFLEQTKSLKAIHKLAAIYEKIGDVHAHFERLEVAYECYQSDLQILQMIVQNEKEERWYDQLALIHYKIGMVLQGQEGAKENLETALAIWTMLRDIYPEFEPFRERCAIVETELQQLI